MSISVPRKTLSADEVMRRIRRAGNTIDLGSGSLLGGASSKFTEDETERSLERLLRGVTIHQALQHPKRS